MSPAPSTKYADLTVVRLHLIFFGICGLLALVLYWYGGATNPFVSLFLVPIAISAATLSVRFTLALAAFCLLAYTLLLFYYQPLQLLSPAHDMVMDGGQHALHVAGRGGVNWHVVGMWLNFLISALLITYFVLRMAAALRTRNAELATIREKQLRDEQLLGIAALAAGTLHELGTPLATMTLLTEELKLSAAKIPELEEDAQLLAEQLTRCKLILRNLARAAEQPSDQLCQHEIQSYLHRVLADWQRLKPDIPVKTRFAAVHGTIGVDSTFDQAMINLLTNAAEASPAGIEVSLREDPGDRAVYIHIRDHGAGVSIDAGNLGKPFVSTRGRGRGLGLFLSMAIIRRLGGQVDLQPHAGGGTLTTIKLPGAP
ncbi:MAG: ATP-binding protein [Halioglobus sp.]